MTNPPFKAYYQEAGSPAWTLATLSTGYPLPLLTQEEAVRDAEAILAGYLHGADKEIAAVQVRNAQGVAVFEKEREG
jgi:hypothetical protein